MLSLSAELLSLSGEAALLIKGGKVLFANEAACALLGHGCTEKSVRELFGDEIAGVQAPSYVGECEVCSRRVLLRVSSFQGMRAVFLTPCGGMGERVGDAFLYSLRSELMNLNVSASLLRARIDPTDSAAMEAFCCAAKGFYRINRTLRNLTVIRSAERGDPLFLPQPLELGALLRDLVETVRLNVDTAQLQFDAPGEFWVTGSAELLELMALNLISNALRHAAPTHVQLRLHSAGEQVILSVNDDGCGIPAGQLHTALERCRYDSELSELDRGPGLGLSAVRSIARLHGGTLLLESREGVGTAVRISLNRAPRGVGPMQASPAYTASFDNMLTGLADCLPAKTFAASFSE